MLSLIVLGITYLATFVCASLFYLFDAHSKGFFLLTFAIQWIPGIVAIYYCKREKIELKLFTLPKWLFFLPGLVPILFFSLFFVVYLAGSFNYLSFSKMSELSGFFLQSLKYQWVVYLGGITFNMFFCLGSEMLWRKYLWEKWKYLGIIKSSSLIGLTWGVWLSGIFFFHADVQINPWSQLFLILMLAMITPSLIWLQIKGKALIVPAALSGCFSCFYGQTLNVFSSEFALSLALLVMAFLIPIYLYFLLSLKKMERTALLAT